MVHDENSLHKDNDASDLPKKRNRIYKRQDLELATDDPLELKSNRSTAKARKVFTEVEKVKIDLWFDKHYLDRDQHGDDLGKRDGIDNDTVEDLVRRSIRHMIVYSTMIKGFTFINRNLEQATRPIRIVLQEQTNNGLLSVVIECHFISVNEFEITVKTAMCKDDFKPSDNQYIIEVYEDGSVLKKCEMKRVVEVCTI